MNHFPTAAYGGRFDYSRPITIDGESAEIRLTGEIVQRATASIAFPGRPFDPPVEIPVSLEVELDDEIIAALVRQVQATCFAGLTARPDFVCMIETMGVLP